MKKYAFIMVVYEFRDDTGTMHNSVGVEVLDKDIGNAKSRALKLAGTKKRNKVYVKSIIEQDA